MAAFYKPEGRRNKILILENEFRSDLYAVESWAKLQKQPNSIVEIPVNFRDTKATNDTIVAKIAEMGSQACILALSAVHYLSSQFFDIERIQKVCKKHGVFLILQCSHAAGAVELKLHDWNVDAAVWCNYKYLSSGPGAIGGLFVHERHLKSEPGLAGWWGNKVESRFSQNKVIQFEESARKFAISCVDPMQLARVKAASDMYRSAGGIKVVAEGNRRLNEIIYDLVK